MNPQVPNSYKNFLPSNKFIKIIGTIAIVAVLVFTVPKIITWVTSKHIDILNNINPIASIPSSDPTTRDSTGAGIPDWELIAAGINPQDPNAAAEFEKFKTVVGSDNFETAASNASDSDKVGLVMLDELSQDATSNGSVTSDSISAVTGTEVANYIQAQQAKNKTYSASDLTLSDDSDTSVQKYYNALINSNPPKLDSNFITHVTNYIQGKESKSIYVSSMINSIQTTVTTLLAIPVPPTAVVLHISAINALSGLAQTLDTYDQTNKDALSQLGTVALVENYYRTIVTGNANFQEYFSVALPPISVKN